ncbi:MAG: hypothetical protein JWM37_365 [Candidatus Saccharibacteria bacterium]|nr:hypothetical protein [Candidatus Saccharibacteria bacterium]
MGSVCPGFLATGPEAQATSDALGKGSYHVLLGQLDRYDAATSYARENVDALGCSSSPASYKLYL